jgi:peptidoglycan/xylan/chitin deacetylase (PgdA/CDA1 family)
MRSIILKSLEFVARLIPSWFYPLLVKRKSIDFFYHAVSDEAMEHARHLYPVVPVKQFEGALDYLQDRYQFVPYSNIHANYMGEAELPPRATHISFDDGFKECFTVVRPLLLERSIPGTFFLSTDWIDNQAMFYRNKISLCVERLIVDPTSLTRLDAVTSGLSTVEAVIDWLKSLRLPDEDIINQACSILDVEWEQFLRENQPYLTIAQIQQMHAEGFTIGAHTKTHRKLMDLSEEEIEEEIVQSCRAIQEITSQEIVPFSFPHSAFGIDRGLLLSIRVRNPLVGLLFDTKGVRKDENFIVNRVWAERPLTPERILHPIPQILRNAYQEAWVEGVMGSLRAFKN